MINGSHQMGKLGQTLIKIGGIIKKISLKLQKINDSKNIKTDDETIEFEEQMINSENSENSEKDNKSKRVNSDFSIETCISKSIVNSFDNNNVDYTNGNNNDDINVGNNNSNKNVGNNMETKISDEVKEKIKAKAMELLKKQIENCRIEKLGKNGKICSQGIINNDNNKTTKSVFLICCDKEGGKGVD